MLELWKSVAVEARCARANFFRLMDFAPKELTFTVSTSTFYQTNYCF